MGLEEMIHKEFPWLLTGGKKVFPKSQVPVYIQKEVPNKHLLEPRKSYTADIPNQQQRRADVKEMDQTTDLLVSSFSMTRPSKPFTVSLH